jgi:dipeptidyl aminopeptidase/acylaminoacyl peptidase
MRRNVERRAELADVKKFSPATDWRANEGRGDDAKIDDRSVMEGKTSPDGKNTAFLYMIKDPRTSKTREQRLFLERTVGGERIEVTPDAFYVDQYWWSLDGKTLYYSERQGDGHSPRLMAYSMEKGSSRTVFASASSDYFTEFAMDPNSNQIVCLRERNTAPAEVVLIDAMSGAVRRLVDLNPEFNQLTLSPATRMEGINSYGESWYAYLVKPSGYSAGKRYPLIVTTYRSGDYFLRGASGDESPIQVYAANGFAVLCFDVGKPRNFEAGDFQSKVLDWSSPTTSIEMAVQQLVHSGLVDPEKVGITGFSHGEEIVGYAVTHSTLFHAAVGVAGYDPSFYYIGGNVWHQLFGRWGLGGWPEGAAKRNWEEIAMTLRADRVDVPILENASDSEFISYLPRVVSLQELGKPVELHIYPHELHVRNQPKYKYEIYVRNVDWFRFWLIGEEDASPAKADQTRRWKELRDRSERNERADHGTVR